MRELKNLLRLLLDAVEFTHQTRERVQQRDIFVAIFFQELRTVLEGKASFAGGNQSKKELRALAQIGAGVNHIRWKRLALAQRGFHVARQFVEAQVAHRYAEIAA